MTTNARPGRTGVVAWPRASIRPWESLWSLVHRFLWLNTPNWSDLERSFGGSHLAPFSLVHGVRVLTRDDEGRRAFDRLRLERMLHLPVSRWESATLAWLRGTPVDDLVADMRFCPECLRVGYHTGVFQLVCVTNCPIHGVALVRGCPVCGGALSADLDREAVDSPFACPHCGHRLAPGESLVNPPPVDGRPFAAILRWYRRLRTLTVVAPEAVADGIERSAFAPPWRHACLELLDGHRAPASLALRRDEVRQGRTVAAQCGIHLTEQEVELARDEMENGPRRRTLIYKAYRRHVQKTLPRRSRRMMRAFVDGAAEVWCPASSVEQRNRRTAAYALLLFRSRMERWPDIFDYGNPVLGQRHRGQDFLTQTMTHPRFQLRRCQQMSAEGRWWLDHLYGEELRATYEEAVSQAGRMATVGRYWQSQELSWGANLPYSVGVRRRDRLTFRAWSPLIRHDNELCEI